MTSQYSMGAYPQENFLNQTYVQQAKQNNSSPSVFGTAACGFIGGSLAGAYKYRHPIVDGVVSDTFAKEALNKVIKKGYALDDKKLFKQLHNVSKKIKHLNSPKKFKKLLKNNPEFCKRVYNTVPAETIAETVTKDNLKGKVEVLKNLLEAEKNNQTVNMKDTALACWNEEKKKFIKPDGFKNDKLFNVIKNTSTTVQLKKSLKYGGITAGILGGLTLIYKILTNRMQNTHNYAEQPQITETQYYEHSTQPAVIYNG